MIYVAYGVSSLIILLLIALSFGARLPKELVASVTGRINGPIDEVFATLRDIQNFGQWRPDVKSIEVLPDNQGKRCWKENLGSMVIALEEVEAKAPSRIVN